LAKDCPNKGWHFSVWISSLCEHQCEHLKLCVSTSALCEHLSSVWAPQICFSAKLCVSASAPCMLKALCEHREFQISQNSLLCVSMIALCGHDRCIFVSIALCGHDRSICVSMLCVGMIALCDSRPQSACLPDLWASF
jgi:hypothetical protein